MQLVAQSLTVTEDPDAEGEGESDGEGEGEAEPENFHADYNGCYESQGCFGVPTDCQEKGNCEVSLIF